MQSASCDTGLTIKSFYFPQLGRIKVSQVFHLHFLRGFHFRANFTLKAGLVKSHAEILGMWYLLQALEAVLPLLPWYTFLWVWKLPTFILYQTCLLKGLKTQFVRVALKHKASIWVKPHPFYTVKVQLPECFVGILHPVPGVDVPPKEHRGAFILLKYQINQLRILW